MEIKKLEELVKPNKFVLRFTPSGLALDSAMTPEGSLRHIQGLVATCDLIAEVPEHVRHHFEVCRKLHVYGYFAHEFFTVAAERVYMTLEAALGTRFLQYYPGGVVLVHSENGKRRTLQASQFGELHRELRKARKNGWRMDGHRNFDGGMRSLLMWARDERLLYGQRNRVIEEAIVRLRNFGAHPHALSQVNPIDSARSIRDVAEIINHLWGQATPGGRLYREQELDQIFLVRWHDGGFDKILTIEQFRQLAAEDRDKMDYRWRIVRADHDSDVYWYMIAQVSAASDPTETERRFPVEEIGDYSTWEDAAQELTRHES